MAERMKVLTSGQSGTHILEERTDSCRVSSDHHSHTVVCACSPSRKINLKVSKVLGHDAHHSSETVNDSPKG